MKRNQVGQALVLRASCAAVVAVVAVGGLAASAQALEIKVPGVATVGVGEKNKVADVKLLNGSGKKGTIADVPLGNTKVHVGTGGDSTADVTVDNEGGGDTTPKDGKDGADGNSGKNGRDGTVRIIRGGDGEDGKDGRNARGSSTTRSTTVTRSVVASVGASSTKADKGTDTRAKADVATDDTESNTTADDLTSSGHSWWFWALWSLFGLLVLAALGWLAAAFRRRKGKHEDKAPADDNEAFLASLGAEERDEQSAGRR